MTPAQILMLINAGLTLVEALPGLVEALKQSKELTPEEEKALDDRIANLPNLDHWKV